VFPLLELLNCRFAKSFHVSDIKKPPSEED
jgi:hypothetical protein